MFYKKGYWFKILMELDPTNLMICVITCNMFYILSG